MNKFYIYIYTYSNIKEYYKSVLNFKMVFKYFITSYVCFSQQQQKHNLCTTRDIFIQLDKFFIFLICL